MLVLDNTSAKPKAKLEVAWGGVTVRIKPPLRSNYVKYWEIIADNLSKAGWSWGYISAIDSEGRTIWIADAHRCDGKRYVVRADEKLTAFIELESATRLLEWRLRSPWRSAARMQIIENFVQRTRLRK